MSGEESWVEGESESRMAESDEESESGSFLEDEGDLEDLEDEGDQKDNSQGDEEFECDDEEDDEECRRDPHRFFTISSGFYEPDYYFPNTFGLSGPLRQLNTFMDEWSSDPLFDRSRADRLILENFTFTRSFITRLLPLLLLHHHEGSTSLCQEDDHDHMEHFAGTCTTATDVPALKFPSVGITNCPFYSSPTPFMLDKIEEVCTPNDKNCLLSALAQVPGFLKVDDSYSSEYGGDSEILSGLLNMADIDCFKATELDITVPHNEFLSDLEFIRLGAMIQRSEHLTHLTLHLPFELHEIPRDFFDHLGNLDHLHMLSIDRAGWKIEATRYPSLMFGEGGNGMVGCLLRNPQSPLIKLVLHADLDDDHLTALAQLLPASNIRTLDLNFDDVGAKGFLEFARQFPKMLSLNSIALPPCAHLRQDTRKEDIEACGNFFVQGLMENPSLTWFNIYADFPQRHLMMHYLSLNRAGRKLLSSSQKQPIPDGLWPHVLESAGASREGAGPYCFCHWYGKDYVDHGPVNAVYFFLRNCPKLLFPSAR